MNHSPHSHLHSTSTQLTNLSVINLLPLSDYYDTYDTDGILPELTEEEENELMEYHPPPSITDTDTDTDTVSETSDCNDDKGDEIAQPSPYGIQSFVFSPSTISGDDYDDGE